MKKIITHINPDLDAVASVWLIKSFLPNWEKAEIGFVQATSSTAADFGADNDSEVLMTDVNRGKLDHHQTGEYLSAARLCWEYIKVNRKGQALNSLEEQAIEELVEVVTQVDNARDLNWEEISQSRYQFYLHILIDGLRGIAFSDQQVMEFGFQALDAVLLNLKSKIKAEEELKTGMEFQTRWGKAIAVESGNKQVLWRGEALGFVIVVKKDPDTGGVQIYSRSDSAVDLTAAHNKFKEMNPQSDWFLHATKKLLLNQSSVNPNMRPTKLSLAQMIEVLKK